jgi:hypothetical protein
MKMEILHEDAQKMQKRGEEREREREDIYR